MREVILTSAATRITPIIKVVGERCNLKCTYCYYNHLNQRPDDTRIMPRSVIESFIRQYLEIFDGQVVFVWHGGEPMLAGLDFFRDVIEIENAYKNETHIITNAIQTNGILINEEWAQFFRRENFRVSLSVDGIPIVHDKFRKNIAERGTSDIVAQAIATLRQEGIEPNVLQTITKHSLPFLKESFDFFINSLKLHNWGINVFRDIEQTNPLMKEESINNEDYYYIITTIFNCWVEKNDPSIIIREIEDYSLAALGKTPDTCSMSGNCTSFITFDWDGTVYPCCDNIVSDKNVTPRNLANESLIEILNSNSRIRLAEKINALPARCHTCDLLQVCYNGCTYHRENGFNPYCEANRRIVQYFKNILSSV